MKIIIAGAGGRNPPGKNVITGEAGYYPDGSE